nr:hypothetical protein [Kibdelosporangium sp. MJ126-NF4]CTQ94130.1 hypothetical protein [Kibdelosporangium sp. MJ126-NF4]
MLPGVSGLFPTLEFARGSKSVSSPDGRPPRGKPTRGLFTRLAVLT